MTTQTTLPLPAKITSWVDRFGAFEEVAVSVFTEHNDGFRKPYDFVSITFSDDRALIGGMIQLHFVVRWNLNGTKTVAFKGGVEYRNSRRGHEKIRTYTDARIALAVLTCGMTPKES